MNSIPSDTTKMVGDETLSSLTEVKFQTLFEENPTMYFIVNQDGFIESVNKYGARHLGYKPQELTGQHVRCVIHQDDIEFVNLQLHQCLNNPEDVFEWEFRKVRKDGSVIWVKENARAIRNLDGHSIVMIVCEDNTTTLRLNTELRWISAAFQSTSDAIVITDTESHFLLANKAFQALITNNQTDSKLEHISTLFIDDVQYEDIYRSTLRTGSWHGDLKIQTMDKRKLDVSLRTDLIKDHLVRNIGIAWLFTDISDRILYDREIDQLKKKTAIVEKKAIIGQLTAQLMHEINNPLHIILGKLYLLEQGIACDRDDQNLTKHLTKIKEQVYRINSLVKNTQHFTRQNTKYFDTLDINTVIDRSIHGLGDRFDDRIRIYRYYQNNLPGVMGDDINLGLAIANIILSLMDFFQDQGDIAIYTSLMDMNRGVTNEKYIEIRIEDNISEILADDLPHIFEPFIEKKSISIGSTIGLTITKDIIEKHHGHISVENRIEKGTKFIITIPLAR